MWASVVDGEKVWADLWPRSSLSPIGSYLDARTWEVVQVSALRKRMLNSDVLRPRKGDKGAIRLAKGGPPAYIGQHRRGQLVLCEWSKLMRYVLHRDKRLKRGYSLGGRGQCG